MQFICFVLLLLVQLSAGESQIDALLEVKKGIQIDPSGKVHVSWDPKSLESDGCPKDWYGIGCSNGRVTSITLNDLGLVGEFQFSAISGLQNLHNLSISSNQLSGTLTKEIGLLQSLQSLDLSRNLFKGPVPTQFTTLKSLVLANLSFNSLGGEIPSGFSSLETLRYLDFRSNGFIGDVMGLLGQIDSALYVDLSSNMFSGTLDIGLGNPDFISSIQYLNISHNKLTGELFPHDGIPYFDSLEVFDATDNQFVGNVPSFSFIVSLRVLKISNNQLAGSLPQGLLQESSMILSELDLSHNHLEGPVGSITSENLRTLNLSYNKLSGPLPLRIGHCAIIDLSHNMFSGDLSRIQSWGNYIEVIDLSSNELTGFLPNQTSQFLRLTSIKISNNSVGGVLPPVLGTYPELEVIDFSVNQLSGSLLLTLFNSTKLTEINLSFNKFSGTIPTDVISSLNYSLVVLNLSYNELTGYLPIELGRFHLLENLDLSNNRLEGGIPDDLPDTIREFNVSYNNLSGIVPGSLQKFPSSSFHPGNYLLILPNEGSLAKGAGNLSLMRHGSHIKSAIRKAIIAGVVGGASILVILVLLVFCRVHQERVNSTSAETGGRKVGADSGQEHRDVPSAVDEKKDHEFQESARKTEVVPCPVSTTQSANTSHHQSESSSSLKVCSPGKLAGDLHLYGTSLKFTAEELSAAPAEPIDMSCHGTLYKAVLASGHVLAVKLLKEGIAKGRKEFAREAKKLGNIRHPNLVSLQGFYWGPKEHEKLIITKYIDAPSLALYIHGTDLRTLPPLSLEKRLKIAIETARCLTYLHNESAIPHGNLKSTNILIEIPTTHTLLTDYSLHRLLTSAGTAEQVLNAGALGYRPPEFANMTKPCPSLMSDVYAFGVILLELLTGRRSADIIPGNPEVVDLSEWVRLMAEENRENECFDPEILGTRGVEGVPKGLTSMLEIALKCVLPAAERPDMKMVFEDLSSVAL
ncbi:putative LRR receptor-like serine/threonine-protein kinase-like [Dorcoceras hygrometricum]|uniref:Putative LRR receptor-like serine/threonine-protein kinase-like n=1 Tax=Dorcoceras hygrometricum TaxID=472368 RepID=A0A2Z7CBP0_9LAMI|nr:putative LRR receptor-like serine/threonine-protein kinase-like [Dorcoceras hygrometricum]